VPKGRALLLDFDGTLADSLALMWNAYCAFAGRVGIAPTRAEFVALNGPPLAEIVATLCRRYGLALDESRALEIYQQEIDLTASTLTPSHGARLLLETASAFGWLIAIVTSNGPDRGRRRCSSGQTRPHTLSRSLGPP
jgi:phosphoglycolate phosphatase-like HAD superfamily hydrolase